MPLYAQVKNSKIYQVAEGYKNPPFKDAVDITEEIAKNTNEWFYDEGTRNFYIPQPHQQQRILTKKLLKRLGLNTASTMNTRCSEGVLGTKPTHSLKPIMTLWKNVGRGEGPRKKRR